MLKKRISDSDEEGSASPEPDFIGTYLSSPYLFFLFIYFYLRLICILISPLVETFEGPEIVAGMGMTALTAPVAPISAPPSVPVSAVPTTPAFDVPTVLVYAKPVAPILGNFGNFPSLLISSSFSASLFFSCHFFFHFALRSPPPFFLIGPLSTIPSQFEASSSSAAVSDDAASFFVRFDQPEVNNLGPVDFWASGPPYVDFYGFRVPKDYVSHLMMIYSRHSNFMQEFRLGRSSREHFLKMLRCVLNDIEHNFINSIFARRILQWRVVIQELISVGFAVEFILDHLREIA